MLITQYWINALPFASKEEALIAIEEFILAAPHDVCLLHPFSRDGIFVRVFDYDSGTSGWLTTELFQGFGMALARPVVSDVNQQPRQLAVTHDLRHVVNEQEVDGMPVLISMTKLINTGK